MSFYIKPSSFGIFHSKYLLPRFFSSFKTPAEYDRFSNATLNGLCEDLEAIEQLPSGSDVEFAVVYPLGSSFY
jgi:hypothetical protein